MSNVTHLSHAKRSDSLTASEVLEAIPGLTYRQLDFWTRSGRVKAMPGRTGSGHYNRYAPDQVAVAKRMYWLLNLGFNLNAAHLVATERKTAELVLRGVSTIVIELVSEEDGA